MTLWLSGKATNNRANNAGSGEIKETTLREQEQEKEKVPQEKNGWVSRLLINLYFILFVRTTLREQEQEKEKVPQERWDAISPRQ